MSRGKIDEADVLHGLVVKRLKAWAEDPECTPQQMDKVIKFLKDNNITEFIDTVEGAEDVLGGLGLFRPTLPDLDDDDTLAL